MSTVKSKKLQVGTDATATNNFTIYQPATPDGTLRIGVGNADSPTEVAQFTSAGMVSGATSLTTASGSAPSYSARAWVHFNGTGTVAINASGNVSSITDNGTGEYTVNFTTAMPDIYFSVSSFSGRNATPQVSGSGNNRTTSSVGISTGYYPTAFTAADVDSIMVQIFR